MSDKSTILAGKADSTVVTRRKVIILCCVMWLLGPVWGVQAQAQAMDCSKPEPYQSENSVLNFAPNSTTHRSHAIAMHGEPKYPQGFDHFDYVNPHAQRGGRITLTSRGTFNSFNTFIEKGNAVSTGAVETLTVASADEPFTQYGLIAESMEWPADRSSITFYINRDAKWHDGRPITADDVLWTFNTLVADGQPFYRYYYNSVSSLEKIDTFTVKFHFSDNTNRELPLIVGQLPVLPKHYWENRDFTKPTLEPPLGSGPYKVKSFEPGRFVTLERFENYWGDKLSVRRGHNNFDEQHVKYYRDDTAIRLSLKAGESDLRIENQAKAWATDYKINAVEKGWLRQRLFETSESQGMQAFIMNLRRPVFQNPLVREALDFAFDFEWSNRNLFYSQYQRTNSYWSNSELAATGEPQGEEKKIIEHYSDCLPDAASRVPYIPPTSDGTGWPRENIEQAASLLRQAGYEMRNFKLVNRDTGEPLRFEILYSSPTFERIVLPYVHSLKKLGIDASARIVDQSQYVTRLRSFDFDMIWSGWLLSDSPGNELRDFFSSSAADNPASRNYPGIKDPIVDQLIELVIAAGDRQQLVERTRALDRVLLSNHYLIPNWNLPATRMVYWDKFGIPEVIPASGPVISTWWIDENKLNRLNDAIFTDASLDKNLDTDPRPALSQPMIEDGNNDQTDNQETAHSIDWLSGVFPLLLLIAEIALIRKLHRFLNRNKFSNQQALLAES